MSVADPSMKETQSEPMVTTRPAPSPLDDALLQLSEISGRCLSKLAEISANLPSWTRVHSKRAKRQYCALVAVTLLFTWFVSFSSNGYRVPLDLDNGLGRWGNGQASGVTAGLRPGPMATYLSPADLMERPLAPAQHSIPRLFHQSKVHRDLNTTEVPEEFKQWSTICREKHPGWEWVLWTDDDNLAMVRKFLPWLVPSFEGLNKTQRSDVSRNAYMMLFGGVYADLDTECLLPTEQSVFEPHGIKAVPHSEALNVQPSNVSAPAISASRAAFLGRMGGDEDSEHSVGNAWAASTPAHPFFFYMLEWTRAKIASSTDKPTEDFTGPGPKLLHWATREYQKSEYHGTDLGDAFPVSRYAAEIERTSLAQQHNLTLLPWHVVYPYSSNRDGLAYRDLCSRHASTFNNTRCKEVLAVDRWPSTSITYSSDSFERPA